MTTRKMQPWLGWISDFHTPGYVPVREPAQSEEFARAYAEAGVQEVILLAKCHFGFSYYPTQIGTPHPKMQGDMFGSLLRSCRARELQVLAYVSFGIDGQAAQMHPEWAQYTPRGLAGRPGHFISVCPFTGYLEESVLPQVEEIFHRYRPDGFWFDTMGALRPCFCESCKAAFESEGGHPIPHDADREPYADFGQWRRRRGRALIDRVARFIHGLDPQLQVGFNQIGSLPYPEPVPDDVTMLSLDPATDGAQSVQFSLNVAYGISTGKTCDVMPTIFNSGWGDWSLATPLRMEQVAATVWARGARLHAGDRLHPAGVLTPQTRAALSLLKDVRASMSNAMPNEDAKLVPDVLLLHSTSLMYGGEDEYFAVGNTRERLGLMNGAHRLLLDAGANFTVVGESFLDAWLPRAHLVVVPELKTLSEETRDKLQAFVEHGGAVLLIGAVPHSPQSGAWNWCGIESDPQIWHDHIYLPPWDGGGESTPVLVRGAFHRAKPVQAEVMLRAIEPFHARPDHRFGWGIAPPSFEASDSPLLTRRRMGSGEVLWLGAPICSDYAAQGNWQQFHWFAELLNVLLPPRRAWLENPHGGVELVVWESGRSTHALLVNHHGEQLIGGGLSWSRVLGPLPAIEVKLHFSRAGARIAHVEAPGWEYSLAEDEATVVLRGCLKSVFDGVHVDWR
jgi:hypothetical protein